MSVIVKSHRRPFNRLTFLVILLCLAMAGVGVGLLGSAWVQLWGKEGSINAHQETLKENWNQNLSPTGLSALAKAILDGARKQKNDKPASPAQLSGIAYMSIPRLGLSWVVVEGTRPGDILAAPGHYAASVGPGERGNFAVAGHRTPGIFWDLDLVKPGDSITVQNKKGKLFTYTVTRNFITSPASWAEVSSTPPGFTKGSKVLTLTTCSPKWDNFERLVIHAVLKT